MSDKIHQLLLQINKNATKNRTELRRQINKPENNINKRLKEVKTAFANQRAGIKQMFGAT